MTPQELRQRLADFARDVRLFSKPLLDELITRDIAVQLIRASSSVASNHRAAGRGRSHAEFTAKIGVALEEADESQHWLQHLRDCDLADQQALKPLLREAGEIVAILTSSAGTARDNGGRGRR